MPAGRPTDYKPEVTQVILARLSCGESLRSVCRDDDMPHLSTIYDWLGRHPEFAEQYARAKEESADAWAEKIADVADGTLSGEYDPQAARVAMDGYKWTASKLKPRKYGDKIDANLNHSGSVTMNFGFERN